MAFVGVLSQRKLLFVPGIFTSTSVLLITSNKSPDQWIVPAGGVEAGEENEDATNREILEEAGVCGNIVRSLGMFQNDSSNTRTMMYVLHINEIHEMWQDAARGRQRRWFPIDEAWARHFYEENLPRESRLSRGWYNRKKLLQTPNELLKSCIAEHKQVRLGHLDCETHEQNVLGGLIQVLLVTSNNCPDEWIIPAGGVEAGEEFQDAAVREVSEEAGVCGNIVRFLGMFQNDSSNSRTMVYVLLVNQENETWPDAAKGRRRRWFSIDEAWVRLSHRPSQQSYLCDVMKSKWKAERFTQVLQCLLTHRAK